MASPGDLVSTIIAFWIFIAAVVWFTAEAIHLSAKIKKWLERFQMPRSTYVEQAINQMYGNVNVENREGSDYRKSSHGIKEARYH